MCYGPRCLCVYLRFVSRYLFLGLLSLAIFGCGSGGGDSSIASGSTLLTPVEPGTNPPDVVTPIPDPVSIPDPADVVFFRDNAPGGGDGSSTNPYNNLITALAATAPGETLFLYAGSGNPVVFTGNIPDNIVFQGEGFGLTTTGAFQLAAGAFPRIQGTVTLGTGNTVRGIQFENTAGNALVMGQDGNVNNNRFTNLSGAAVVLVARGTISIMK